VLTVSHRIVGDKPSSEQYRLHVAGPFAEPPDSKFGKTKSSTRPISVPAIVRYRLRMDKLVILPCPRNRIFVAFSGVISQVSGQTNPASDVR
jgi:hypothetical protein